MRSSKVRLGFQDDIYCEENVLLVSENVDWFIMVQRELFLDRLENIPIGLG